MGTGQQKAAQTKTAIIDAASRLFQERGYDAVGIADIMGSIGLTNGGFYKHFGSKSALAAEVTRNVFERTRLRWEAMLCSSLGSLEAIIDDYLRLDNASGVLTPWAFGCSSGDDVDREQIRDAYGRGLNSLASAIATMDVKAAPQEAKEFALSTLAGMMGALAIARGMSDPVAAQDVLSAVRRQTISTEPHRRLHISKP